MVQSEPPSDVEQGWQQPAPVPQLNEVEEFEPLGAREPLLRSWVHRLPGQLLAALLLVAGGILTQYKPGLLPATLMRGVTWALSADVDPASLAGRARTWAARRGGWGPALQATAASFNSRLRTLGEAHHSPLSGSPYPAQPGRYALPVTPGSAVVAAGPGVVRRVLSDADAGRVVELGHSGGVRTVYSPLEGLQVAPGQQVAGGQPLGRLSARSPRLRYEVLQGETEATLAHSPAPRLPSGRGT